MARGRPPRWLQRFVTWPLQAAAFHAWIWLCARLPVDAASNLGGWIGRTIGPRLGPTRRAYQNLRLVFPAAPQAELDRIVRAMWDNLGRTAAEYPHLATIADPGSRRVERIGFEHAQSARIGARPIVAFSGHFANFEVMQVVGALVTGSCTTVVREPNNPLVRGLLERCRGVAGGRRVPKGSEGARQALATLGQNGLMCVLVDQRMSDGVRVPFFGYPADTAAAPAQMALRFDATVLPVRLERTGPGRFRMTMWPPLELPREGTRAERAAALTAEFNRWLEGWIRDRPEDWLWLHRRWPREVYARAGR